MAIYTGRSFVAEKMRSVPPSGIRKYFDIINTMPDAISLGVGEPDFVTPQQIREAGILSLKDGKTKYSSNAGMRELRVAISQKIEELYGVSYDPDTEIVVTVGVSEALQDALLATVDRHDEVLVAEPCFVSYKPAVFFAGGVPVPVPSHLEHNFSVTAENVSEKLTEKTRGVLIGYPCNPTGAVLTREDALGIAKLAQEHDLLVYSDEIYDRLVYGVEHICMAALPDMKERTVLLGGFSKSYAMTGWRIGYACAPKQVAEAIYRVHQYTVMCAPTMAQYAAIEALKSGEPDVEAMRQEYDRRRRLMTDGFNAMGMTCFEPQGAFYCFPRIGHIYPNVEEFCEKLIYEAQVAVVPGAAFGECGAEHIRACYATSYEKIEVALERIGRFLKEHA